LKPNNYKQDSVINRFFRYTEGRPDPILFFILILLWGYGLLILLGVNIGSSQAYRFFIQQAISFVIGIILFVIGLEIPLKYLKRFSFIFILFSLFLMILVFIPGIGHARSTSSHIPRWIGIKIPGFSLVSFQPVEVAKVAIIIFLSYRLSTKTENNLSSYLSHLPIIIIIIILTGLQPNFGSAVILVLISASLIFVSGIRLRNIFSLIFMIAPIIFISLIIKPYQNKRILAWLDPYKYSDLAFQILESFKAFYEGGLLGKGIGQGRVHRVLPDRHNDFIFAITANDYGFIGALALVLLYLFFTWRTILILRKLDNQFYKLVGFGLLNLIIIQAILNMAVVTGLVPTTGISLPFISLGGSNLVMNMFGMGLLLNITAQEHTRNRR